MTVGPLLTSVIIFPSCFFFLLCWPCWRALGGDSLCSLPFETNHWEVQNTSFQILHIKKRHFHYFLKLEHLEFNIKMWALFMISCMSSFPLVDYAVIWKRWTQRPTFDRLLSCYISGCREKTIFSTRKSKQCQDVAMTKLTKWLLEKTLFNLGEILHKLRQNCWMENDSNNCGFKYLLTGRY